MDYIIENEYLKVTVTTNGAQLKSVVRKCDGAEHVWQADPSVWGYHAPILFPMRVRSSTASSRPRAVLLSPASMALPG